MKIWIARFDYKPTETSYPASLQSGSNLCTDEEKMTNLLTQTVTVNQLTHNGIIQRKAIITFHAAALEKADYKLDEIDKVHFCPASQHDEISHDAGWGEGMEITLKNCRVINQCILHKDGIFKLFDFDFVE